MTPVDTHCDAPGCHRRATVMVNGDPTVLPRGWGALQFRSAAGAVIDMDFCPIHLRAVVVPWVAVLGAKEAEAVDLGIPAPDQDAPLPVHSRASADDDLLIGDDVEVPEATEVVEVGEDVAAVVEWGLTGEEAAL